VDGSLYKAMFLAHIQLEKNQYYNKSTFILCKVIKNGVSFNGAHFLFSLFRQALQKVIGWILHFMLHGVVTEYYLSDWLNIIMNCVNFF